MTPHSARAVVYVIVALFGAGLIVFQLFPEFENTAGTWIWIAVGAILVIDGVRSLVRWLKR